MGGCSEWPQWNGFCPNGLVVDNATSITRPLDPVRWSKAEERTAELISHIQPNRSSENHRNAVASYVQRLVSNCVPCQVFTFGSVPLKTYLPDGDIDLTAFSEDHELKDTWGEKVQTMLQKEEKNELAEFPVKEVQLIQAEVRIIKCLVDNIVVDISFNQLGGLCTLCFLEEVDNLISQNHLFKRSIILIKAWCFYESRLLGAHHGLISTYALETLVLYIFHVFNNSFAGPLEVLYRFLEFFSKFDWDNFCVSLWGPVPISSLPSMTGVAAAPPRKDGGELLLKQEFLDACGTAYSFFPAGPEQENRLSSKFLNVIDPLRLNNNLGRSVSKGNFYRIRSAFILGAQQLAKILECPVDDIVPELNQFFVNTWERHGKDCPADGTVHDSLAYLMQPGTFPLLPTTRTMDSHKDLSSHKQKDDDELRSQMSSGMDHYSIERNKLWKKQHDVIKRTCMMNMLQTSGHTTHHFARTSSSPELTNVSSEASSSCRYDVTTENDDTSSRSGYSRRKVDPGTMENHAEYHVTDDPSIRESSSDHTIASGSCVSKPVSSSTTPAVYSVPEQTRRIADEQGFMNNISSSGIQHYGGHAQMPVNLAYSFVPFPPSIMGYNQQNFTGTIPTNFPAVESDRGDMMNYSNGPFPVPYRQQIRHFRGISEQESMSEGLNEIAVLAGVDHVDEDFGVWIDDHTNRELGPENEDLSTASSRISTASPSGSSRIKASSESSWDGKPTKITNVLRYPLRKNGRCTVSNRREEEGGPFDHSCEDVNDDPEDWVHVSADNRSVPASHLEGNQIPGFEQPQINCQNSVLPFGSEFVHPGSHQGFFHIQDTYYHAGASAPFLTMVPVYNLPAGQDNVDRGKAPFPLNRSGSTTDSHGSKNLIASGEPSDKCGSDILNSDFISHWHYLQYGRFCQGSQFRHPVTYSPCVPVTSLPLQGTTSVVSPGRSNAFGHVVPLSAHQPGSVSPAGVSRQYGREVIKQRNGTGTYIPNPDIIKECQCPTPRHYQGDYHYDRNVNYGDREFNRNFNSKPRYGGRGQPRNYHVKQNTTIDGSATSISQTDRTWGDTFPENSNPLYCLSKCPSPSNSAEYNPDVVDYSVYQVDSVHNDEVTSAGQTNDLHRLVTLYPYPNPGDYGSWTDNLQFGSVKPEHFLRRQEHEFNGHSKGGSRDLQHFGRHVEPPSCSPMFSSG